MAGSSMTFTYDETQALRKITVDWVSDDTTGAVSGTTKKIVGQLIKGVTDPSGTAAPTDNYDIAITDELSFDVLTNCMDNLADRDTANTEEVYFLVNDLAATDPGGSCHPSVCDKLGIAVTNAGNSKEGQIVLYYQSYDRQAKI